MPAERHPLAPARAALALATALLLPMSQAHAQPQGQAQAQTPATGASAATAPRHPPLLNFQRVLERAERPQPQHKIAYGPAPQQFGELWLPPADRFGTGPHPVVLLVHGGCWMAELPGPELLAWQAEALRQQGQAVWSISYRRVGHEGGGYPGTFQDVARGADQLRELARTHPLDLGRITASGHSAGGHLALWAASAAPAPGLVLTVSLGGVADLRLAEAQHLGDGATTAFLGGPAEARPDLDPVRLAPPATPVALVHGADDAIVPSSQARAYADVVPHARLTVVAGAGHFAVIDPLADAWAAVVGAVRSAT